MKNILLLFIAITISSIALSQDYKKYRFGISAGAMDIGAHEHFKSTFGYEAHLIAERNLGERLGVRLLPGIVQHGGRFSMPELGIKETTIVNEYANLQAMATYRILDGGQNDPDIVLLGGLFGDYSLSGLSSSKKIESGYLAQMMVAWYHVEVGAQYSSTLFYGSKYSRSWENMGFKVNFVF